MNKPHISVVMSVYDGVRYLHQAVESILAQTFTDFELILIDDGSKDDTCSILEEYKQLDPRVIVRRFEENRGLTVRLNDGIRIAQGEYIARMDADDISLPQRFERQVEYMDQNPQVGIVGSQMNVFDDRAGLNGKFNVPCAHNQIAWALLFGRSFAHPSIMIRRVLFEKFGGYDESFHVAQDHELWGRMIWATRFANLPDVLIDYRSHIFSTSRQQADDQKHNVLLARKRLASQVLDRVVSEDVMQWMAQSQIFDRDFPEDKARLVLVLLLELFDGFRRKGLFEEIELDDVRADLIEKILLAGRPLMNKYQQSRVKFLPAWLRSKHRVWESIRKLRK